jgi:mono/diheme cytochrome c family protein
MKNFTTITLILATIVAFTFACGDSGSKKSTTKTASSASAKPKAVDGSKIYKLNCTVCHGVDGSMGASGAHDLTKSELSLEERIVVITNGRNTMTPFSSILSEEKIKAVAEYTMTLK